MKTFSFLSICLFYLITASVLHAREFETFDGRYYNGLYYPRVDIVEWGEQYGELPHMEFHLYSKGKPIEMSIVPGMKGGTPVLWLVYDLTFRGEKICRHVVAPKHFKEGMALYLYRDNSSDSDFDYIYVSSEKMKGKNFVDYKMEPYVPCIDEFASNMPGASPAPSTNPAPNVSTPPSRMPASAEPNSNAKKTTPPTTERGISGQENAGSAKKDGKNIGVDYENHAMPFSF